MKCLKLVFIYKKHDTFRYVTFLYTKSYTLRKNQDNLLFILYTKIRHFCVTRFFIEFLKFAEGGEHLFTKKTMYFVGHFYIEKQCTLRYVAIYKEPDTMRYILISKKQYTFLYVYIYMICCLVLIPNYKRPYDQSDQIENKFELFIDRRNRTNSQ